MFCRNCRCRRRQRKFGTRATGLLMASSAMAYQSLCPSSQTLSNFGQRFESNMVLRVDHDRRRVAGCRVPSMSMPLSSGVLAGFVGIEPTIYSASPRRRAIRIFVREKPAPFTHRDRLASHGTRGVRLLIPLFPLFVRLPFQWFTRVKASFRGPAASGVPGFRGKPGRRLRSFSGVTFAKAQPP